MWLEKQGREHLGKRFKPQPWDQLIKVLHDTGYAEDAIKVAIEKNKRIFRNNPGPLRFLYGLLYGFGYRPYRVLWAAFLIWLIAAAAFYYGAESGFMVPTDPKVMVKPIVPTEPKGLGEAEDDHCAANWTQCRKLIGRYTTFEPLAYSLDYILPLVDLNQKKSWAPQVVWNCAADPSCPMGLDVPWVNGRISAGGFSIAIFTLLENLFGWIAGGVLAAVMGGLIKKD
jgi:hypothetical protein